MTSASMPPSSRPGIPLRTVDLALDLRSASVEIPELVITKRPGEAGAGVGPARAGQRAKPGDRGRARRVCRLAGRRRRRPASRSGALRSGSRCASCAGRWATSRPTSTSTAPAGAGGSTSAASTCGRSCSGRAGRPAAIARPSLISWSRSPRASYAWAMRRSPTSPGPSSGATASGSPPRSARQHRGQPGQSRYRHTDTADRRHPARQRRRLADPGFRQLGQRHPRRHLPPVRRSDPDQRRSLAAAAI